MLFVFLLPLVGLVLAFLLNKFWPKAKFRGYDVLPFFLIWACYLITAVERRPDFLPYGFFVFFFLVIIVAVSDAIKNKNISLGKTLYRLWNYLTVCSIFWYIGLLVMMI
ncbi:DUF3397 domain-containing protein [Lactobacillus sp. ESL0679]|uniref:DUF3397 domain-containing protein n=1 Tax=unclassified Lactobacillus TaxID=2620435 RepID=UPI0023F798F8|nr:MULTISPECIES: DUF3397 domain-containing protein [unclassified Lactobacillus]MDF7682561.1 DUF3397 domain-containing protein [Lactobacillus sp. ESL0679]WEV37789.1 DUF3397 domain-containing protein [Lactobacillus sp. ESL0677]